MPTASTLKPARLRPLLALLLGVVHAWLASSVSDRHSCVYDEPAHAVSGLLYWKERDFRLQPENGLLPQLWLALPLALSPEIQAPPAEGRAWLRADIWELGEQLLHGGDNRADVVLRRARLMNALASGALVMLITLWAWSIGGAVGAALGGGLAAFSPTLLAHAGFATSDTMGALGFVAATLAYWRLLHRVCLTRVLGAGGAAALLALSKYSAGIFPLIATLLLVARLARRTPLPARSGRARGAGKFARLALGSLGAAATAWVLVWAAYGFRFEAGPPRASAEAGFIKPWDAVLLVQPIEAEMTMADGSIPPGHRTRLEAGPVQQAVAFARDHRLLPEAWLYGCAFVERHSRFRLAYFAGQWSAVGWREFFPVAYLIKSTPSELFAHLAGLAAVLGAWRGVRRLAYRAAPLLVAGAVYGGFALTTHLNIGHRHLLPLYALGAVLAAFVPALVHARRRRLPPVLIAALGAVLLAQVASSFAIRPSYLAYFNILVGGPDQGHRYLADSSLDWGQDLPALRDWLDENPAPKSTLYVSYFGNGSLVAHGIDAVRIADDAFDHDPDRQVAPALEAGRYAIGATMWTRIYTQVRGPWTAGYEARYRQLRIWLAGLARGGGVPTHDPDGQPMRPKQMHDLLRQYDQLRFGRLLHQLARRTPDARVAHNWFIFDLDAAEIDAALNGPLLAPSANAARPASSSASAPAPDRP